MSEIDDMTYADLVDYIGLDMDYANDNYDRIALLELAKELP